MKTADLSAMDQCNRAKFVARLAAALLLLMTTGGCLETQREVFGSKEGAIIPGIEGEYLRVGQSDINIGTHRFHHFAVSRLPGTNDYRYVWSAHSIEDREMVIVESRRFRAILLRTGVYAMQSCQHYSKSAIGQPPTVCHLYFFNVVRSDDTILEIDQLLPNGDDVSHLAERRGIDVWSLAKDAV